MKVAELIEKLKEMPQDADVDYDGYEPADISGVEYTEAVHLVTLK